MWLGGGGTIVHMEMAQAGFMEWMEEEIPKEIEDDYLLDLV